MCNFIKHQTFCSYFRTIAPIVTVCQSGSNNNMFYHYVEPNNGRVCSFLGSMGGSNKPVAQLTLPSPICNNYELVARLPDLNWGLPNIYHNSGYWMIINIDLLETVDIGLFFGVSLNYNNFMSVK